MKKKRGSTGGISPVIGWLLAGVVALLVVTIVVLTLKTVLADVNGAVAGVVIGWACLITAVLTATFLWPVAPGTEKKTAAALAAQGTTKDQRVACGVGWVLVISTIGFMLALVFVPLTAGIIAMVTWSKDQRKACSADPACVISTMPENALPVWIAFVWISIIAAALIICWKPSRWWLPSAEARRHVKVRTFTSPDWIRIHALVAAGISIACAYGVVGRYNEVYAPEYGWAVLTAFTVATAATVCKKIYGFRTPNDVKVSLALTGSAAYGVLDKRWRAAQRQLHPRGRKKQVTDGD